jgi:hypothetical protein
MAYRPKCNCRYISIEIVISVNTQIEEIILIIDQGQASNGFSRGLVRASTDFIQSIIFSEHSEF